MRQMYESAADLTREELVIATLCNTWGTTGKKNPCPPYKIDYTLFRGNTVVAMVEVKSSKRKYPNYRMALHKYLALLDNHKLIPTIIAVKIINEIYYCNIGELEPVEYIWWSDGRQRDATDNEVGVVFNWDKFKTVRICT